MSKRARRLLAPNISIRKYDNYSKIRYNSEKTLKEDAIVDINYIRNSAFLGCAVFQRKKEKTERCRILFNAVIDVADKSMH